MSFTGTEDLQFAYLRSMELDRIGNKLKSVNQQLSEMIAANKSTTTNQNQDDKQGHNNNKIR